MDESNKNGNFQHDSDRGKSKQQNSKANPNDNPIQIIAVTGAWGSGKTTVKNKLKEKLEEPLEKNNTTVNSSNDCEHSQKHAEEIYNKFFELLDQKGKKQAKNNIVVDYSALQFEEKSQVTAELYNTIAKSLPENEKRNKSKLYAIATLKKESAAHGLSTQFILSAIIFAGVLFLTNEVYNLIYKSLKDSSVLPWILLSVISLLLWGAIADRDWLLQKVAGILPRKSHIDILKSIRFNNEEQQLILLIDEIDRLSPESTKLLFDEILIIKEAWKQSKLKFKILLFYDEQAVFEQYLNLKVSQPHIFLQKYYDSPYRIGRILFQDEIRAAVIDKTKTLEGDNLSVPSAEVINNIAMQVRSFREKERLITEINSNKLDGVTYIIHFQGNNIDNHGYTVDLYYIALSLRFFYDLGEIKWNDTEKIHDKYLNLQLTTLKNIYYIDEKSIQNDLSAYVAGLADQSVTRVRSKQSKTDQSKTTKLLITSDEIFSDQSSYCKNIRKYLEYFDWGSQSQVMYIKEISLELNNKNIDFRILLNSLISELTYSIHNIIKLNRNGGSYCKKYIAQQYSERIKCMRFYLALASKLNFNVEGLVMEQDGGLKLNNLVICAFLGFGSIHSFLFEGYPIIIDKVKGMIDKVINEGTNIQDLFNQDIYVYQAVDLVFNLRRTNEDKQALEEMLKTMNEHSNNNEIHVLDDYADLICNTNAEVSNSTKPDLLLNNEGKYKGKFNREHY